MSEPGILLHLKKITTNKKNPKFSVKKIFSMLQANKKKKTKKSSTNENVNTK